MDLERIVLSQKQIESMHRHAEEALPQEAVALILGTLSQAEVKVSQVECLDNVSKSGVTSFAVDPEIQYEILIAAEERDEEMVGIFHSHPAPPNPSSRDRENMRLNPVVWLIASKMTGEWESRAFLYRDKEITEIQMDIIDAQDL